MPTIPSFELVLIVGNIKPTQVFFQAKSQANFFSIEYGPWVVVVPVARGGELKEGDLVALSVVAHLDGAVRDGALDNHGQGGRGADVHVFRHRLLDQSPDRPRFNRKNLLKNQSIFLLKRLLYCNVNISENQ